MVFWRYFTFFIFDLFLSEGTLRTSAYGSPQMTVYLIAFTLLAALLCAILCSVCKERAGFLCASLLGTGIALYYAVNLIYQHTFKSFLSVSQIGMGGAALNSFGHETLLSALEVREYLLTFLIPLILLFMAAGLNLLIERSPLTLKQTAVLAAVFVLGHGALLFSIHMGPATAYGAKDLYTDTFVLALSEKTFGSITSTRLELQGLLLGGGTGKLVAENTLPEQGEKAESVSLAEETENGGQETPLSGAEPDAAEPEPVYGVNAMEIDFAALAASLGADGSAYTADEKEKLAELDGYFGSAVPTSQNAMTGRFQDYNLITIVCESFSPWLIDEERTPALYRLSRGGILFDEYYSTICDNTSNSEYVVMTGLLPDASLLGKGWENFYEYNSCTVSQNNTLPFTMGNQAEKEGIRSLAFHYYYGNYYGRNKTHPNFGYEFYYMLHDLKKTEDWPTSDLEMMQQSLPKLLTPGEDGSIAPFNAYFLTFSGHMYYNFSSNRIAAINKEISDGMTYGGKNCSEAARAYVSCNQELEKALEYLLAQLEEAGVLDQTLIVLTQDHYPYTLGLSRLSEIAGKDLQADDFEKEFNQYRGALLMWTPSMEGDDAVRVSGPVCELDILPTLSNLFGLEYDSRLLMGKDVFAGEDRLAILMDRSFVTEDYYYDASSGAVTVKEGGTAPSEEELSNAINMVKNRFTLSNNMLYTDYYRHVFGE